MRQTIIFKLNTEIELPEEVINAIPRSGLADNAVSDLRTIYDIDCNELELKQYLKSFGAWDSDELADHDSNIDRLIWLAALDCRENNSQYFYMGS